MEVITYHVYYIADIPYESSDIVSERLTNLVFSYIIKKIV